MPIIGQYTISDVAKISSLLHERYGRIVRFSGLIGRPDLLFIYDADEIEKVSTTGLGTCRNSFMGRQHARLGTHGAQQSIKAKYKLLLTLAQIVGKLLQGLYTTATTNCSIRIYSATAAREPPPSGHRCRVWSSTKVLCARISLANWEALWACK